MSFKEHFHRRRKMRQTGGKPVFLSLQDQADKMQQEPAPVPTHEGPKPRKKSWYSLFLLFFGVIVLIATSVFATPLLHKTEWIIPIAIAGGAGVVISIGSVVLRWRSHNIVPGPFPLSTSITLILILASFFFGTSNTLIIDGKAYLSTSSTAKAYKYSEGTYKTYLTISEYDRWVLADAAATQARASDFEPAARKLKSISKAYTTGSMKGPTHRYEAVSNTLAKAALLQAEVLELKEQNITRQDIAVDNTIKAKRAAYGQLVITAMNDVNTIGSTYYNFNMDDIFVGPRE